MFAFLLVLNAGLSKIVYSHSFIFDGFALFGQLCNVFDLQVILKYIPI